MLKNDPKMSPILVHKTSKKEQKRLPKWDPLKKTPKGGQMEPKWLQNELKMEPKLIENATNMLKKWVQVVSTSLAIALRLIVSFPRFLLCLFGLLLHFLFRFLLLLLCWFRCCCIPFCCCCCSCFPSPSRVFAHVFFFLSCRVVLLFVPLSPFF